MVHTTHVTKPISAKTIVRNWHIFDASDLIVGRLSSDIARLLQGKQKTTYAPYLDAGDYVVVINAQKVRFTGKKEHMKVYTAYSGYPGGLKSVTARQMRARKPGEIVRNAVSGMLPKNKLRKKMMARLFIFPDTKHPYADKFVTNVS